MERRQGQCNKNGQGEGQGQGRIIDKEGSGQGQGTWIGCRDMAGACTGGRERAGQLEWKSGKGRAGSLDRRQG